MRFYLKKIAALGFLVFLTLWVVGAIRGITLPYPPPPPLEIATLMDYSSVPQRQANGTQNFANNLKLIGLEKTPLPMVIDADKIERIQIHEKVAQLASVSTTFEEDEAKLHPPGGIKPASSPRKTAAWSRTAASALRLAFIRRNSTPWSPSCARSRPDRHPHRTVRPHRRIPQTARPAAIPQEIPRIGPEAAQRRQAHHR